MNDKTAIATAVESALPAQPVRENSIDTLNKLIAATTFPEYQEREIEVNGVKGTFTFRRLPYAEMDALRLSGTGKDGSFDPQKYAGNNGRWVVATLVDPDTHQLLVTDIEVNRWDAMLVDKLAEAAIDVNGVKGGALEAIAKN